MNTPVRIMELVMFHQGWFYVSLNASSWVQGSFSRVL